MNHLRFLRIDLKYEEVYEKIKNNGYIWSSAGILEEMKRYFYAKIIRILEVNMIV
jgi:uncharacterized membrane protein